VCCQALECVIDGDDFGVGFVARDIDAIERHVNGGGPAAALGLAPTRNVDEHSAHHLRRHAKEVAAVLPTHLVPPQQAKTDLVHESRRLKRDVRTLAGKVAERHPMQLVVDERYQMFKRALIAIAPDTEHTRDVASCPQVVRLHD
jgi:hypothetical protein